jgi:CheY-like chemotaxis protein
MRPGGEETLAPQALTRFAGRLGPLAAIGTSFASLGGEMIDARFQPARPTPPGRLNLLLSESEAPGAGWSQQMPRLLEPLGVSALLAHNVREAARYIELHPIHIAVVDMAIPLDESGHPRQQAEPAGTRVLQLLARLDAPPPTVLVRDRRAPRESARQLCDALQAGAFAVIDRPVNLEIMLETMRRAVRRFYADTWPDATGRRG